MNDDLSPETIKEIRTRLSLSQEEFGHVLKVSRSTVCNWENGHQVPQWTQRRKLRTLLHSDQWAGPLERL